MEQLDRLLVGVFQDEAEMFSEDTPFAQAPSWDSLKHVELVVAIQTRFAVDLSADEIHRMTSKRTVREVLAARGAE